LAQGVNRRQNTVGYCQQDRFGQLQFEQVRRQAGLVERLLDDVLKTAIAELQGRQIDRNADTMALAIPFRCLPAGLEQHPAADGNDHPGVLSNRDELQRTEQSARGMIPADQCLHADDGTVADAHLRLVVKNELLAFQGTAQATADRHMGRQMGVHAFSKKAVSVPARRLGMIHGGIGLFEERFEIASIIGAQRDASGQGNG